MNLKKTRPTRQTKSIEMKTIEVQRSIDEAEAGVEIGNTVLEAEAEIKSVALEAGNEDLADLNILI